MSFQATAARFARRCLDKTVASVREFLLVAAYAAVCIAITAPAIIATGGAIYWLGGQLGVEGWAYTVYFGAGALVIMFVFAMLHRVVQFIGQLMLGASREPYWRV